MPLQVDSIGVWVCVPMAIVYQSVFSKVQLCMQMHLGVGVCVPMTIVYQSTFNEVQLCM